MKKLLAIFIALVTLLCVTGCTTEKDNKKDNRYDVTIKITSNHGGEWIFTPDIKELHIVIPYDGLERYFYVDCYQLKDHPRWSEKWFDPHASDFRCYLIYCPPGGNFQETNNMVKEKGEYCYTIETEITSKLFIFRAVYLYVSVV